MPPVRGALPVQPTARDQASGTVPGLPHGRPLVRRASEIGEVEVKTDVKTPPRDDTELLGNLRQHAYYAIAVEELLTAEPVRCGGPAALGGGGGPAPAAGGAG